MPINEANLYVPATQNEYPLPAFGKSGGVGYVLTPATTRTDGLSNEASPDFGASFDIKDPTTAFNIIESMPDGTQNMTKVSSEAVKAVIENNKDNCKGRAVLGFKEAAASKTSTAPSSPALPARAVGTILSTNPLPQAAPCISSSILQKPRIPVKFRGTFGKAMIPCEEVYSDPEHPELLILVQYNEDGNHCEAPQSDGHFEVDVRGTPLNCASGIQFRSSDGKKHFTVLAIVPL